MLRKRIRHINRYREIVTILVKYGFGYIVKDVGLFHLLSLPKQMTTDLNEINTKPLGKRIRLILEELGPTFVKLGQILSLRTDLIPEQITKELEHLQDKVPPADEIDIEAIILSELGAPAKELFADFDKHCLAAASIGQVYKAVLKTGETVVVKIRRPNIESLVNNDIEILWDLATLVEHRYSWAKQYQICDIVDELSRTIQNEMDYFQEGRNTEKISKQFEHDESIIIPKVYWDYSSKRVLTVEYIEGKKYADLLEQKIPGFDNSVIADRLVRSFLDQVLIAGVYHGDPHPGNLFFLPGNKIAYIDFGQVGVLSQDMKENFAGLIIELMKGDIDALNQTIRRMAIVPENIDNNLLKSDLGKLREKYYDLPFKQIHIGEVINDLFHTTQKHRIRIPKNYTLLGKALITLEGIVTNLDPDISVLHLAEPYGHKLLLERFNPRRLTSKMRDNWTKWIDDTLQLPLLLKKTLSQANKGQVHLEMDLPQIEQLLLKLDRVGNRISFSIILLAFSIVLVGLIIGDTFGNHPFLTHIPILGIGLAIAIFMFLSILFAIFRSGRF